LHFYLVTMVTCRKSYKEMTLTAKQSISKVYKFWSDELSVLQRCYLNLFVF